MNRIITVTKISAKLYNDLVNKGYIVRLASSNTQTLHKYKIIRVRK